METKTLIKKLITLFLENKSYIKELISDYIDVANLNDDELFDFYLDFLTINKEFTDKIQILYEKKYKGFFNAGGKMDWGAIVQAAGSLFNLTNTIIGSKGTKDIAKTELEAQKQQLLAQIVEAKAKTEKAKVTAKVVKTLVIGFIITIILVGGFIIIKNK